MENYHNMKTIELTQGKFAIVDDKDFEWLSQWKWCSDKGGKTFYAIRVVEKNKIRTKIYMHRLILNTPRGMDTDHKNGNGLDNRRENLRVGTHGQNVMNSLAKGGISGEKGVYPSRNKWVAAIYLNYKKIHLGVFLTKNEAKKVYQRAALQYFGEFVRINP